jgi:hypothetical protein
MNLVFRSVLLSAWILCVGLLAVSLEAERIRIGHRIHDLLGRREVQIERVRRLEIRYNRMVSPDLLSRQVPDSFLPDQRLAAAGRGDRRS